MDKRIGAQLYTVRDFVQDEKSFEETMKKLSDIGFKSVQISGVGPIAPEAMRDICRDNNLAVSSTHKGFDDYKNNIEEMIKFHKALGCDIAGLGSFPNEYRVDDVEALDGAIEILNTACEKLRAEGIDFAYHNHAFEFARLSNGQSVFERLLEKGKFSFIFDTYWAAAAGFDAADWLKKLGDRVAVIHYKDMKAKLDNSSFYAPVGEGNMNFDSIVKASDKARWAMIEQDFCDGEDPIDCLSRSYRYLVSNCDFI